MFNLNSSSKIVVKKSHRGICIALVLALTSSSVAFVQQALAADAPGSAKEKVSYALGVKYGQALKKDFKDDLSFDFVVKGIKDSAGDKKLHLTDEEIQKTLAEFQQRKMSEKRQEMQKVADKNQVEGDAYLTKNKVKEGVKTLESGLQYKVIQAGKGETPKSSDKVKVHYHGSLIDGTVFDSSIDRGEPITFPVSGVIKGWTEALQLMPVGSKWQLYIPSDLAYGPQGTPSGPIGPNQTLIFEVELLAIES